MATLATVKIDREVYAELTAEAKRKLRSVKLHLEDILRKHFKRLEK